MDKQYKVDGDEDASLMEVPISFIISQESKVDVIDAIFCKVPLIIRCFLEQLVLLIFLFLKSYVLY